MSRRATTLAFALTLALWNAIEASAQQWYLETQAGRIRFALDPAVAGSIPLETPSVITGIRYDHPFATMRVSAGLPTNTREPVWAAIGGWKRVTFHRSRVFAGLDLAANGFLMRDRSEPATPVPGVNPPGAQPSRLNGYALAGQALPVLGFDAAAFEVRGRAGVSLYESRLGAEKRRRTVRLADVQVTYTPESVFAVTPVLRVYGAEEGRYTYGGVTGIAGYRKANVWASIGQWVGTSRESGAPWAIGGTVKVHPRVSLNASRRYDTVDPLYLSPPQTSWGVGISVQIGGPAMPPPQPLPAAYVGGRATIRLAVSESASAPRIAGDFNSWQPQLMERAGNQWSYSVVVSPGVYNYAFVDAKGQWFVPKNLPGRRDDGMGGHVAVLVVR